MKDTKKYIKINAIIMSSGSGKTTLAKQFPNDLIDIDTIIHTSKNKLIMKELRRKALKLYKKGNTNAFDKVNNSYGKLLVKAIKKNPELINKIFLIHTSNMFGDANIKVNVIKILKSTKLEINKVAKERAKIDPIWGELTIKNWSEIKSRGVNYESMKKIVKNIIQNKYKLIKE